MSGVPVPPNPWILSPWLRGSALALHLTMIALILVRAGFGAGAWWTLPLLLPLRGLIAGRDYTLAWASMLIVFYVAGYLSQAVVDTDGKWPAIGMATIAALEFVTLTLAVRFRARERAALARGSGARTAASGGASR